MRLVGDADNTVEIALRNAAHRGTPPDAEGEADMPITNLEPLPNQVILLKSTDILWLTRNEVPQ